MAAATLLSADELKPWLLRRLGAPALKVELDEGHLEDAIEAAQRWFAAKKGVQRQQYIDIYTGVSEYHLDDDVDTVLDVAFPTGNLDVGSVFAPFLLPDQQLPYNVWQASESMGVYSNYVQTLQYIETAKRVLGAEMEWRQEGRTLIILPVAKATGKIRIEYKSHNFTIEQLTERDHDLLKRWALAHCKRDLGTIWSKYVDGFPTAQGQIALDGHRLLEEAEKELLALEEEISMSAMPMGFVTG